jgi:hypothetical protein
VPGGLQVEIDGGAIVPPVGGLRLAWHGRSYRFDRLPVSIQLPD